jgi:hypothetical protein
MKAFRRMALEGASGAEVAGELGLSVGASIPLDHES